MLYFLKTAIVYNMWKFTNDKLNMIFTNLSACVPIAVTGDVFTKTVKLFLAFAPSRSTVNAMKPDSSVPLNID